MLYKMQGDTTMIRRFIRYYKPHIGLFILDMTAAVIIAVCNLFYPTVVKDIMNRYVYLDTPRLLIFWSCILLGVYLLKAVCTYIVGFFGHLVGVRMQADMRRDLFRKYERLPFSYFDDHKTGDLLSRLVNDLFEVSELAHHGPENLFLALLMLIGSFVILVRINPTLTLIMFCVTPFIILFATLSRRSMHAAMKASRVQTANVNVTLENSLAGIRETKAYVAEARERAKFDRANGLYIHYRKSAIRALASFDSVMALLQDVIYLAVIFVGGLFFYYGRINAGEFAAFVLYVGMFLGPIQRFVALFEQLQEGMTGFARFAEIMEEPEEEDRGTVEPEHLRGDISFRDVSFCYRNSDFSDRERMVISGLNLDIRAGETLALVGPSGGGKTTLCHLIPRFYNVTGGHITLDGTDLSDFALPALRRHIGIVSQNVFLFDGTVRENIAYGKEDATDEEVAEAARRAEIHDYIMTLEHGYDTPVGERGLRLSGGQKQRISIARVFLKNPSILILDEATSALDSITEKQIQKSLEELSRGRTVIVVAHRLSTVKNADKIAVLDRTGIREMGTHEELMALGGEYKRLHDSQFSENTALA